MYVIVLRIVFYFVLPNNNTTLKQRENLGTV